MIGGVAGGLAAYFDVDPTLVRLGFVALVLLGPLSPLVYVLAWVLLPLAVPAGGPQTQAPSRGKGLLLAAIVLLLAGPVFFGLMPLLFASAGGVVRGFGFEQLLLALLLFVVGLLLLRGSREEVRQISDRPSTEGYPTSAPGTTRPAAYSAGSTVPTQGVHETYPQALPGRVREPSSLLWLTVAAIMVALGVLAMLDNVGVVAPTVGTYFATMLIVIGAGLTVGAVFGRGRWLILLGAVIVPAALAASVIDMPLRGHIGTRSVFVDNESQLASAYHVAAGELILDMTALDLEGATARTTIDVVVGQAVVFVPSNVDVFVEGEIGAGAYQVLGVSGEGVGLEARAEREPVDADGRLEIAITGGVANLEVFPVDPLPPERGPRDGSDGRDGKRAGKDRGGKR